MILEVGNLGKKEETEAPQTDRQLPTAGSSSSAVSEQIFQMFYLP